MCDGGEGVKNYVCSDLASECGCTTDREGVRVTRQQAGGCEILRVQIKTEEGSAQVGKPCGRYVTVECGDISRLDELTFEEVRRTLAVEIKEMAERMTGKRVGADFSVLVAGLGNADMTPDAVGPETVRHLFITRHLQTPNALAGFPHALCEIAAFSPGVLGQTGLETQELVRGAVGAARPDLVIAIDALAARETARLGTTVQLADNGIQPGGGIGRGRRELTKDTVGVPVMARGVPTVVNSATLILDALLALGVREGDEIYGLLESKKGFFVAPKEIDLLVRSVGVLLAAAIEKSFSL